jgi:hypothetical protein
MRTASRRILLAVGAAALLMSSIARTAPIESYPQVIGVRQLDVGFNVGVAGFKARVTLVTGEAMDVPLETEADTRALIQLAQIVSSGAGMTATVDGRRVLSIQCVVRPNIR